MSKSWKKILVTGASLLMMASVGAGLSSNNTKVSAKSGYIVRYEGKNVHLGNGNARKSWLLHGQRLKLYNYKTRDVNGIEWSASQDGFVRMSDVKPLYYHHYRRPVRRHYRKHARKHYRRPVKKAKKHVTRKRKARKAHKAIKRQTKRATAYKPSRKVNKFRKSAYYHNSWTRAEKLNERGVKYDLKMAKKYAKNGNTKAAKRARQKANYLKNFVKHDQTMINLGK